MLVGFQIRRRSHCSTWYPSSGATLYDIARCRVPAYSPASPRMNRYTTSRQSAWHYQETIGHARQTLNRHGNWSFVRGANKAELAVDIFGGTSQIRSSCHLQPGNSVVSTQFTFLSIWSCIVGFCTIRAGYYVRVIGHVLVSCRTWRPRTAA